MTIRYAELAAANTSVAQRHRAGKSGGILGDHSPRRSPLEPDSARQAEFDATRQSSMRCQLRGWPALCPHRLGRCSNLSEILGTAHKDLRPTIGRVGRWLHTHTGADIRPIVTRIGRARRLPLLSCNRRASAKRHYDQRDREPSI